MKSQGKMTLVNILILCFLSFSKVLSQNVTDLVTSTLSSKYEIVDRGNALIVYSKVKNMHGKKPLSNSGEVSLTGFDLKKTQNEIIKNLRLVLTPSQKTELGLSSNIMVTLFIRRNGNIDEVSFLIYKPSKITYTTLNVIENLIMKKSVIIKRSDVIGDFDFVPVNFILRGKDLF